MKTTTVPATTLPAETLIALATAAADSAYDTHGADMPSPADAWGFLVDNVELLAIAEPLPETAPAGWYTAYRQAYHLVAKKASAPAQQPATPAQRACVVCGGTAFDYLSRCSATACVATRVMAEITLAGVAKPEPLL